MGSQILPGSMKPQPVALVAEVGRPVESEQVDEVKERITMVAELLSVIAILLLAFVFLYVAKNFMN